MACGFCNAASITLHRVPAVVAAPHQGQAVAGGLSLLPPTACTALPESELRGSLMLCSATFPGSSRRSLFVEFGNEGVGARLGFVRLEKRRLCDEQIEPVLFGASGKTLDTETR